MNRETVFSLSWAYALRMSREKQFRCSAGALIDKFPKGTQSREEALFAEATFAGRSPKRAEANRASSRLDTSYNIIRISSSTNICSGKNA